MYTCSNLVLVCLRLVLLSFESLWNFFRLYYYWSFLLCNDWIACWGHFIFLLYYFVNICLSTCKKYFQFLSYIYWV